MPFSLLPKAIFDKVTQITPSYLLGSGVSLLMLDFDNTLLPYTSTVPSTELLRWLDRMKRGGIRLCVVSNSHKDKAARFCAAHNIGCVRHANKPGRGGIRRCLARYGLSGSQAALAGDQIYTDVLGANLAGVTSILVRPIHLSNLWLKLRHVAEKPVIFLARKRRVTE